MSNKTVKIEAVLDSSAENVAIVKKQSGKVCQYLGKDTKSGKVLNPEEILFLLETGRLKLMHNSENMTLEKAYELFLNKYLQCTLPIYKTYRLFLNNGYKVKRTKQLLNKRTRSNCKNDFNKFWNKLRNLGPKQYDLNERNEAKIGLCEPVFDVYVPIVKSIKKNDPNFQVLITNDLKLELSKITDFNEDPIKLTIINKSYCTGIYRIGAVNLPDIF